MTDDTKQAIQLTLEILRTTLVNEGVSLAVTTAENGALHFFDTETYLTTGKFDGIKVSIDQLVK